MGIFLTSMFMKLSPLFMGILGGDAGSEVTGEWTIGKFLGAGQASVASYAKIIIMIIGVVMVAAGVYQVAKNLITHGKGQTNWVVTFALIIIGGALMLTGGFNMLKSFGKSGQTTLTDLGKGEADTDGDTLIDSNMDSLNTIVISGNTYAMSGEGYAV